MLGRLGLRDERGGVVAARLRRARAALAGSADALESVRREERENVKKAWRLIDEALDWDLPGGVRVLLRTFSHGSGPPRGDVRCRLPLATRVSELRAALRDSRLRALLSRPPVAPVPHPWPLPKFRQLFGNIIRGVARRRPLAREA